VGACTDSSILFAGNGTRARNYLVHEWKLAVVVYYAEILGIKQIKFTDTNAESD